MSTPNESSFWWLALVAISSSGIAVGAVAYLIKTLLSQWLTKEMQEHSAGLQRETESYKTGLQKEAEQFRTQLQHEKDQAIEKLRAELNQMALEHQVKFSQLHTKVFATIAHLYRLIAKTQRTMASFLTPVVPAGTPPEIERGRAAIDSWHTLVMFFREHEIYFDKETCAMVEQYLQELKKLHIDFQHKQFAHSHVMEWNRIWEKLTGDVQSLKQKLADNFRGKIGIEG